VGRVKPRHRVPRSPAAQGGAGGRDAGAIRRNVRSAGTVRPASGPSPGVRPPFGEGGRRGRGAGWGGRPLPRPRREPKGGVGGRMRSPRRPGLSGPGSRGSRGGTLQGRAGVTLGGSSDGAHTDHTHAARPLGKGRSRPAPVGGLAVRPAFLRGVGRAAGLRRGSGGGRSGARGGRPSHHGPERASRKGGREGEGWKEEDRTNKRHRWAGSYPAETFGHPILKELGNLSAHPRDMGSD